MPNASRRPDQLERSPSRIPRRGAVAALATTAGLALLLSFRTPDALPLTGLDLGALSASDPTATGRPRSLAVVVGPKATATAGQSATQEPSNAPTTEPTATPAPTTEPTATSAPTTEPTAPPAPTKSEQVIDGTVVNTRFGPVQVEVTISDGTITDVQALQLPYDRQYSAEISDYVAPYLRQMALTAQSANIDIISGATYTSAAYAKSLQSALNAAN